MRPFFGLSVKGPIAVHGIVIERVMFVERCDYFSFSVLINFWALRQVAHYRKRYTNEYT